MEELEQINYLSGYPNCPACDTLLTLRSMPKPDETYWYCTGCGTQWETPDIIAGLNQNAAIVWALGDTEDV